MSFLVMNFLMSFSLPAFTLLGLFVVFRGDAINAFIMRDLKVNHSVNFNLAVRGHVLSEEWGGHDQNR